MPKIDEIRPGVPAVSSQKGNSSSLAATARLAINLFDLTRLDPLVRLNLALAAQLDAAAGPIRVDKDQPDETAVAFKCNLLRAAALCDVIRNHDRKVGDPPTRVYLKRQVWARLPGATTLTVVGEDDDLRLNPTWFPEAAPIVELEAPSADSIFGD